MATSLGTLYYTGVHNSPTVTALHGLTPKEVPWQEGVKRGRGGTVLVSASVQWGSAPQWARWWVRVPQLAATWSPSVWRRSPLGSTGRPYRWVGTTTAHPACGRATGGLLLSSMAQVLENQMYVSVSWRFSKDGCVAQYTVVQCTLSLQDISEISVHTHTQ